MSDGASQDKSGRSTTCATSEIRLRPPEVFKPASSSGQGNGQGKNTGCWVIQRQIVVVVCCSIDTSASVLGSWVSQSFTAGNTNQCMWVNSTPSSWVCFWARGGQGTRFGRADSMSCFEPFLHCKHNRGISKSLYPSLAHLIRHLPISSVTCPSHPSLAHLICHSTFIGWKERIYRLKIKENLCHCWA